MVRYLFCKILGHNYTEWEYIAPESCTLLRTCRRCGIEQRRLNHEWDEWKSISSYAPCSQKRTCKRCFTIEERESHLWDKWKSITTDLCNQKRICIRCGKFEERKTSHEWVEVTGPCYKYCRRCHQTIESPHKYKRIYDGYTCWTECILCGHPLFGRPYS